MLFRSQYWRNVADGDVLKCIRMLTFLPLEEIEKMDSWEGSQLNTAKEILAFELTKLVHGEEEAVKAQESARALFASGAAANMPEAEITEADLKDGSIDIMGLLVASGLCASRSEARQADIPASFPVPVLHPALHRPQSSHAHSSLSDEIKMCEPENHHLPAKS